jgi:phospholipase/carboxylesterase
LTHLGSGLILECCVKTKRVDILGVETLEVTGDDSSIGVVFLHGYGANMHDLFPLWEMWHREKLNWYFPNGLHSLPMGPYEGRAWFSINVVEMERAIREGRTRDLRQSHPPELDDSLKVMEAYIGALSQRHKKIILGGFSQGAMLSSHLAMRASLSLDGLILLSGGLLSEDSFPKSVSRPSPFYQSHGTQDPILSLQGAKDLEEKLSSLNFQGKLHIFQGGHEIPLSVINQVKQFLEGV